MNGSSAAASAGVEPSPRIPAGAAARSLAEGSPPSPWVDVKIAARYLGVGTGTVYREAREGRLRCARIGGRRSMRFRLSWLDDHLEASAAQVKKDRP